MAFSLIGKVMDVGAKIGGKASLDDTTVGDSSFQALFIHPEDKIASDKMKAVPGFETALNKFMELGIDQAIHMQNLTSFLRVTENQLPVFYQCTKEICDSLKIEMPEIYLDLASGTPAYISGLSQTTLILGSSLVRYQDDERVLKAVIAHECGHVFCRNCKYRTLVRYFGMFGPKLLGGLLGNLFTPLEIALNYWYRKSELSADRVAATVCGSAESVIETQMNLANPAKWLAQNVDISAWAGQIDELEALGKESTKDNIVQSILALTNSHAISAIRVREILKWAGDPNFQSIREIMKSGAF